MPRRILNWDVEVTRWAIAQVGRPFAWGETDCASLARAMLGVMYGAEAVPLVQTYTDRTSAERAWRAIGGAPAVLRRLGAAPLEALLHANTGDLLVADPRPDEPFEALTPVITTQMLVTEPGRAVRFVPLVAAPPDAVPWRIPHHLGAPRVQ